ncbi:hypothetical protein SAMN05216302_104920, partial [Nitrosomonas aestuarii]
CLKFKQDTEITWSIFNRYNSPFLVNFRPVSTTKLILDDEVVIITHQKQLTSLRERFGYDKKHD